ncbi:PP2C family protein-serine/threonine phosphatase [Nocardioides sp. SOB77]|uniref:PP2C family protein-serine/threonine phosphatase n=1 Tax=Nocardioides oceani TaxID=3058369 RepID=A0ABT8FJ18_9ACTN|nr:PP2C family protein-serine/threonine phosphatase [Nocardioides oceani]MDN4174450.1 PP2C family protein-serine/threonine phosphatase [Nocardioides oceani]
MSYSRAERALDDLLGSSHLAGAYELPALFEAHAEQLGLTDVRVYLADLQQRLLVPLPDRPGPDGEPRQRCGDRHEDGQDDGEIRVDGTLAGRAFQLNEVVIQELDDLPGGVRLWLPVLDGTERLGVLAVTVPDREALDADDGALRLRVRRFTTVVAELVMSKTLYGDTIVRLRRGTDMGLAAEMQWSLLPPLTFSDRSVVVAGGLEPAYEVAGDSLDYAVDDGVARVALFDGMGHGLASAQLAVLTVSAYRNQRRVGADLGSTARFVDDAVAAAARGEGFSTGLLVELDTRSGELRWVNAGHPDPLLLRDGRLVRPLETQHALPFGLNEAITGAQEFSVGCETLQPGDLVLLHTDGVVEARSTTGEYFGAERLVDLVTRNLAAGLPAPETVRRLIRALLDHQDTRLEDDATLALLQWRPDDPERLAPPTP